MTDAHDRFDDKAGGGMFVMGLLTGTALGVGLGMLFASKAGSELREQALRTGGRAREPGAGRLSKGRGGRGSVGREGRGGRGRFGRARQGPVRQGE